MHWARISYRTRNLPFLAICLFCVVPAAVLAQEVQNAESTAAQPTAETHYWLRVTGDGVNIRSRPDVNSRLVGRVDRGAVLEAASEDFGWHRIVPPAGVHSLIAAEFVERMGGDRGVVRVDTSLRVRVGSDVQPRDPMLSEVQTRLDNGTEVRILGQLDDEWLKIAPPDSVFVYISGEFVERISESEAEQLQVATVTEAETDTEAAESPTSEPTTSQPAALAEEPDEAEREADEQEKVEQTESESEPETASAPSEPPAAPPEIVARGVLRPCFALPAGPYGMRYQLEDPATRHVNAYIDLPPKLGINAQATFGTYIGVSGNTSSPGDTGVKVIHVTHVIIPRAAKSLGAGSREKP